jgi:hypothetical protein
VLPIQVLALKHGVLVGSTGSMLAGLDHALDPNADGNLRDHVRIVLAPVAEPFAAFAESPEAMAAVSGRAGRHAADRRRRQRRPDPRAASAPWRRPRRAPLAGRRRGRRPPAAASGRRDRLGRWSERPAERPAAGRRAGPDRRPGAAAGGSRRPDAVGPEPPGGQPVSGDSVDDYLGDRRTRLVDGKVALVPRDGTSLEAKAIAAAAAGARAPRDLR